MKKNTKNEAINGEIVMKYFQDAFDAAGIKTEVTKNFEKNQSLMRELVEHLVEFGLPDAHVIPKDATSADQQLKISNYSTYLRNILSTARRRQNEAMGFRYELMEPIIEFPKRCTTILEDSTLFTSKKYSLFNFWRSPQIGAIVRQNNSLYFVNEQHRLQLNRIKAIKSIKMSRDKKANWLEIKLRQKIIYLAKFNLKTHQLDQPDALMSILQPKLTDSQ